MHASAVSYVVGRARRARNRRASRSSSTAWLNPRTRTALGRLSLPEAEPQVERGEDEQAERASRSRRRRGRRRPWWITISRPALATEEQQRQQQTKAATAPRVTRRRQALAGGLADMLPGAEGLGVAVLELRGTAARTVMPLRGRQPEHGEEAEQASRWRRGRRRASAASTPPVSAPGRAMNTSTAPAASCRSPPAAAGRCRAAAPATRGTRAGPPWRSS